ncbi:MAG TPA: hypothetical protein VNF27_05175 [Candidatus Binataceae bacterium]|nr:hypothetical protein [Candidatus Binataceae bacterium]
MPQAWSDKAEGSIGLRFPNGDAEIVLHRITSIPAEVDVTYLMDYLPRAVQTLVREGCTVVAAPFDVVVGKCAVVVDPFGTPLSLIDLTKPEGIRARSGAAQPVHQRKTGCGLDRVAGIRSRGLGAWP